MPTIDQLRDSKRRLKAMKPKPNLAAAKGGRNYVKKTITNPDRKCKKCGTPFVAVRQWQDFCCVPCRDEWHLEYRRAVSAELKRRGADGS